jgi:hypothetical protein
MASGIFDDDIHGSLGGCDLQMQIFDDFSTDNASAASGLDFWNSSWDRPAAPLQRAKYGTGIGARGLCHATDAKLSAASFVNSSKARAGR